jgi:hypothetical protein
MKSVVNALTVSSLLALPWAASAQQIYMCKDAAGRTYTSDRPIQECSDRSMRILSNDGTMRGEIAPPLTAEQKRQKREEEEKRKAAEVAAEKQRRQDSALLARYRTEADLEEARTRALELVQDQINREKANLAAKEKSLQDTRTEISNEVDNNISKKTLKAMPPAMLRKLEDSEEAVRSSKKLIADKAAERDQLNAKFDLSLKRLRELNAAQQAAAAASVPAEAPASATPK